MMKRIVSIALIAVMSFSLLGTVYAEGSGFAEKIINKMLQYTSDERKNIFLIVRSMINSDSGVDEIANSINNYSPNSGSSGFSEIINDAIGNMLNYIDKETAVKSVKSLKIVDKDIRIKYLDSFANRDTLKLSDSAMQSIQYFITKTCSECKGLDTLMQEDGITGEVIANLLMALVDINAGRPLFTDGSENNDFKINTISKDFKSKANQFLSDNGIESNNIADIYLTKLNIGFNFDEKSKIKIIGKEIGFYTPAKDVISKGSSSGTAYQNGEESLKYNVIEDKSIVSGVELEGATIIEVALYKNGVKQEFGNLDKDYTITIPVINDNIMVYKITNSLESIKYNINIDNVLHIKINSTGYYGIKYMQKYFQDADGWGSSYIENLYNRGIIKGKSDGVFAPEDNITREEFVKLIIELFSFNEDKYYANFSDVNSDEWYYKYIAIAYKNGIISGIGDNRFGVGENITRQDICKILYNVISLKNISLTKQNISFKDESDVDIYAKESVNRMYEANIISGNDNGYFYPKNNATRQEAAKIIYGILKVIVINA